MHNQMLLVLAVLVAYIVLRRSYEMYVSHKYATLGNTNFRGGDIEVLTVDSTAQCRERCNTLSEVCKGFTVTKGKGPDGKLTCWPKTDETIRPGNRSRDNSKTTYIRKDHWDFWKVRGLKAETTDERGRGCFDTVTVYSDVDYEGLTAEYGCGVYNVTIGVSSIKIPRGMRVRVRGVRDGQSYASGWWTTDMSNVGDGWNDQIKTIEVTAR
jgi:hypothetical protein